MSNPSIAEEIASIKDHRRHIDAKIQQIKLWPQTRERSLAITKLQEAVMWLGMDLKRIGEANPGLIADPYPHSKDSAVPTIEPTADELKM
jgi:hypothetical protein